MIADLELPDFLKSERGKKMPRAIRWKRLPKASPPEGEVWQGAERWSVWLQGEVPQLGNGRRLAWIVEGRKWVRIADAEGKAKIPMALWRQLQRNAVQV